MLQLLENTPKVYDPLSSNPERDAEIGRASLHLTALGFSQADFAFLLSSLRCRERHIKAHDHSHLPPFSTAATTPTLIFQLLFLFKPRVLDQTQEQPWQMPSAVPIVTWVCKRTRNPRMKWQNSVTQFKIYIILECFYETRLAPSSSESQLTPWAAWKSCGRVRHSTSKGTQQQHQHSLQEKLWVSGLVVQRWRVQLLWKETSS